MKQYFLTFSVLFTVLLFMGCSNSSIKKDTATEEMSTTPNEVVDEIQALFTESENYLKNRDLDGDQVGDYIVFSYTGGAHCCYQMSIKLSSHEDTIHYPFEMDGGYGFGIVDGSYYDKFDISDFDEDGLEEIFMQISTYNGEIDPINPEWTKTYGFKTNYILFDYKDGKLELSDFDTRK